MIVNIKEKYGDYYTNADLYNYDDTIYINIKSKVDIGCDRIYSNLLLY